MVTDLRQLLIDDDEDGDVDGAVNGYGDYGVDEDAPNDALVLRMTMALNSLGRRWWI
jgi:hypothetical protein